MRDCRNLASRSPMVRRWHRFWCAKCRAARRTDAILDRGIMALKSAMPPTDGLALTLAAVGIAPSPVRPRSRRWVAALRRYLMPTGAATLLLAGGWFHYMDFDPQIRIPVSTLPSPNAYEYYVLAAKREHNPVGMEFLLEGLPPTVEINLSRGSHLPTTRQQSELERKRLDLKRKRQALRQNAQTLALIRRGLAYAYKQPPDARFRGPAFMTGPVYTNDYLVYPLYLEGEIREESGDAYGAVNSYLDALQIGVEIGHDTIEARAQTRLWNLLYRLNAAQARSTARRMERLSKLSVPLADELRATKWMYLASVMQHFHDPHWRIWDRYMNRAGAQPDIWSPEDMVAYIKTLPYSKRWMTRCYIDQWDRVIADAERPYCARQILKAGIRPSEPPFWIALPPTALASPLTFGGGRDNSVYFSAYYATQNALLTVAYALRAYRLEHGRYPATLAALTLDYLAVVPVDPFTGAPLRYWPLGTGYRLYSVGPDGKDDHGTPINEPPHIYPTANISSNFKVPYGQMDQATFDTLGRYVVTIESQGDIVAGLNIRAGSVIMSGRYAPYYQKNRRLRTEAGADGDGRFAPSTQAARPLRVSGSVRRR
jgi:hypothetical protein